MAGYRDEYDDLRAELTDAVGDLGVRLETYDDASGLPTLGFQLGEEWSRGLGIIRR
jgi:hypothetical protein